jgi:hypothetical protein
MRHSQQVPRPFERRAGTAVVLVLGILALLLTTTVAFLSVTGDGLKMANQESAELHCHLASNTAVQTAIAQLMTATSQTFEDGLPKPWTSQPGGIRVHTMAGELDTMYKLYTAASLTASTVEEIAADLPQDWADHPAVFVDLNEPRLGTKGLTFPIVDPRAKTVNPAESVEGFDYQETLGAVGPAAGADKQRLPMPVRWIYMLRDGRLGTLDKAGKLSMADSGPLPTTRNPIVARYAYWVDDETAKINVNTAGEGSYWDTPHADTDQERKLAAAQPMRLEYNRQPGHPAGVCLSSVLLPHHRLYPAGFLVENTDMKPMAITDAADLWRLGRLAASELESGTSFGGTRESDWPELWMRRFPAVPRAVRYAGAEDVIFDHYQSGAIPGIVRSRPSSDGSHLTQSSFFNRHPEAIARLERAAFFLTKDSSAPETTLFGTPRIALWPVHAQSVANGTRLDTSENSRDTPYNHKVMAVGMIKERPYFVQRSEPGNGGNDFELHAKGSNKALFQYLQRLTSQRIPGFARTGFSHFEDKYGEDRDAILLEIMDCIRSSNCADGELADVAQFSILCPGVEHKGFGQISPLQERLRSSLQGTSDHPMGFGRILTASEVALFITCRAEVGPDGRIKGSPSPLGREQLRRAGDRELDVALLVETFLPGQSWADYRPYITAALFGGAPSAAPVARSEWPPLMINDKPLLPATGGTETASGDLPPTGWYGGGGSLGVRAFTDGALLFRPIVIPASEDGTPPPLQFTGAAASSAELKLAVFDAPGSTDKSDLLQVIPLHLPDIPATAGLKLPTLPQDLTTYPIDARLKKSVKTNGQLISSNDIVQSLVPVHGDYRLIAARRWQESRTSSNTIPIFAPHPLWGQTPQAHNLRDGQTVSARSSEKTGYIPGLELAPASTPDAPVLASSEDHPPISLWTGHGWESLSMEAAIQRLRLDRGTRGPALPEITGDFDNGLANLPDGPYINRPDDGHWAAAIRQDALPYFDNVSQIGARVPPVSPSTFSPQRLLPSPVMFGSLPTGVRQHVPWQTLLFRPQEAHYGARTPPDHLLLDLFWSPVLEPEPLSHHFQTDGKINLNHPLLPFAHITRTTALHAAMKAECLTAIPDTASRSYKTSQAPKDSYRHHIDATATLDLWKRNVFDEKQVFLTASQICGQYLVPETMAGDSAGVTNAQMAAYWAKHRLTGDNSKERPYAHLYSRLTTRSNTYRIHFIAQVIGKSRSTAPDTFVPGKDQITASNQGSVVASRTLDLEDEDIPDYVSDPDSQKKPLDGFYRWHREAAIPR